jgi:hypothetical protein
MAAIIVSIFAIGFVGAAQAAEPPMPAGAATSQAGDTYFVLGVHPKNTMLVIEQVVVEDGAFKHFKSAFPPHIYNQTYGGYIVAKVKGDEQYAIRSAGEMQGHTIFGRLFHPAKETLTFKVPAGKVVYVGEETIGIGSDTRGSLLFSSDVHDDLDAARQYLEIHYPDLAPRLEQGEREMVSCGTHQCRF